MKMNKKLLSLLSIPAIGATIAPIVVLTSCGNDLYFSPSKITFDSNEFTSVTVSPLRLNTDFNVYFEISNPTKYTFAKEFDSSIIEIKVGENLVPRDEIKFYTGEKRLFIPGKVLTSNKVEVYIKATPVVEPTEIIVNVPAELKAGEEYKLTASTNSPTAKFVNFKEVYDSGQKESKFSKFSSFPKLNELEFIVKEAGKVKIEISSELFPTVKKVVELEIK